MLISQEYLKERFNYDAETGLFTWKIIPAHTKVNIGDIAGVVDATGYIRLSINHKPYLAHRMVWLYVYGVMPCKYMDHINLDRADNRLCNLRESTPAQNQANKSLSCKNTSGYKGVYWDSARKYWRAAIRIDGIKKHLGCFSSKELAFKSYQDASLKIHGEFSRFN